MNGWAPNNVEIVKTYSGVLTNEPISKEFPITAGGSKNMVIKVKASAVTAVGTLTLKLQSALGNDWVDAKTTTISSAGSVYIKLNVEVAGDQTFLPLLNKGRIVLTTTNAGDSLALTSVEILQEL